MSDEDTKLVHRQWDAYQRGDIEALQALCHPDVLIVQPPEVPDSKTYEGHRGVAESIEDWPRQWEDFTLDVVEVVDVAPGRLVSVTHQRGRGRESGIEMDFEIVFAHTLEDGKLSRLEMFLTRDEALAAASG